MLQLPETWSLPPAITPFYLIPDMFSTRACHGLSSRRWSFNAKPIHIRRSSIFTAEAVLSSQRSLLFNIWPKVFARVLGRISEYKIMQLQGLTQTGLLAAKVWDFEREGGEMCCGA